MVRSNSFDLTQNRSKKRLMQEKITDENFEIIEYKDFEKIRIMNSPINENILKNIMEKEDFIFVN